MSATIGAVAKPVRKFPVAAMKLLKPGTNPRKGLRSGVPGRSPAQVRTTDAHDRMGAYSIASADRRATACAVLRLLKPESCSSVEPTSTCPSSRATM